MFIPEIPHHKIRAQNQGALLISSSPMQTSMFCEHLDCDECIAFIWSMRLLTAFAMNISKQVCFEARRELLRNSSLPMRMLIAFASAMARVV